MYTELRDDTFSESGRGVARCGNRCRAGNPKSGPDHLEGRQMPQTGFLSNPLLHKIGKALCAKKIGTTSSCSGREHSR